VVKTYAELGCNNLEIEIKSSMITKLMWTREKYNNNMVINDPKGELLVKFYVRATVRGFQVVQFNLINPLNTDKRDYMYSMRNIVYVVHSEIVK